MRQENYIGEVEVQINIDKQVTFRAIGNKLGIPRNSFTAPVIDPYIVFEAIQNGLLKVEVEHDFVNVQREPLHNFAPIEKPRRYHVGSKVRLKIVDQPRNNLLELIERFR